MSAKVEVQKILVGADRQLKPVDRPPIVAGNVKVDRVEFTFEEPADWDSLNLTAYFTNSKTEVTEIVPLTSRKYADIPASVLTEPGFLAVALLGLKLNGDEITQRSTTQMNSNLLTIQKSGIVDYNPDPTGDLKPSIIEEYLEALANAEAATEEANRSISQHNDPFVGATDEATGDKGLVPAPAAGETDLVLTGNAEWTDVHDLIPDKADIDGYYELLTAGAADNLTGRGDTVAASFLYRTAGGDEDIADGIATIECVKGNTVGWNQLLLLGIRTVESEGVAATIAADGSVTLSGTPTGSVFITLNQGTSTVDVVAGHKYVILGGSRARSIYIRINNFVSAYPDTIYTATTSGSQYVYVMCDVNADLSTTFKSYPQIFDLTAMFGAGNEPSTVAEFEALYPEPYYPYDPGTLKPVQFEGIETVGFNQFDGVWNVGGIAWATGEDTSYSSSRRSNYIDVFSDTDYYFYGTSPFGIVWYGANKLKVGDSVTSATNKKIHSPANAKYVRLAGDASIESADVCLNLSWSGYRDGEYEAFWRQQREIAIAEHFPTGMKSAGSVCDALYSDHADHVVGSVDLGTLTWTYNYSGSYFRASYPGIKRSGVLVAANARMSNGFESVFDIGNATDRAFIANTQAHGENTIYIKYLQYGNGETVDLDGFKAAINGVILYYELATPTTETIDPPLNLGYKVSDFGTERVMVADSEISAPPIFEIAYGLNATDTIRRLPQQYISDDSFKNFCDEAFGSDTVTETWDDVNNCYTYSIAEIDDATIAALVDADWRD